MMLNDLDCINAQGYDHRPAQRLWSEAVTFNLALGLCVSLCPVSTGIVTQTTELIGEKEEVRRTALNDLPTI